MKIAIVSDTHGNVANFKKMVQWLNAQNIKTILHCGDIGSLESLKESLENYNGDFFGVFGNMDRHFKIEIEEYNKIPCVKMSVDILETEIGGKRIVITHFPDTAKKLSQSGKYDLVFYGHTHRPWDELVLSGAEGKKCHMINPGELAGQFYKPTFAVYDTATGELRLKILERL